MAGFEDGTIKVWDTDSFNLLETRPGEAMAFSEEAEDVVRNGATILVKDGGGAFYAPSPILYVAVSWPRIAAGAQSGELYHLEVVRERIATRNQLPMKTKKKNLKNSKPPTTSASRCGVPQSEVWGYFEEKRSAFRTGPNRSTSR